MIININKRIIISILFSLFLSLFFMILFNQCVTAQYVPPDTDMFDIDYSNHDNSDIKGLVKIDEFIRDGEGESFDWVNKEIDREEIEEIFNLLDKEIDSSEAPDLTYEKFILGIIAEMELVNRATKRKTSDKGTQEYRFENFALLEDWLDLCFVFIPDWKGETIDYLSEQILGSVSTVNKPLKTLVSLAQIYNRFNLKNKMIADAEYIKSLYWYFWYHSDTINESDIWEQYVINAIELNESNDDQKKYIRDDNLSEIIKNTEVKFKALKDKYSSEYTLGSGLKEGFKDEMREKVKELILSLINDIEKNNFDNSSPTNNPNPAVAVIMDVSGSMNSQSKLGSAKKAINSFIDSQNKDYYLSLASYSTSGKSIVDPISIAGGEDELRRGIDFLSAAGDTNIGSGLTVGLNQLFSLNNNPDNSRMILLSDGRHNTGKLWPVVEECSEKRIKVDTVAFGSDADYDTLYKIANMTDGRALKAGNKNLSYIYHRISNQIQNYSNIFASKDFIKPGQKLNYLVNVDSGIEALKFYTNWQGSNILMEFTDPDGNKITPDKDSAKYIAEETYNIYEIEAQPGQWEMSIIGSDLPAQGEQVNVSVSGKSSFYTNFLTFQPEYSPGSEVIIGIEVDKVKGLSRIPLDNVKVNAKIHKPSVAIAKKSGNEIEISLEGLFKAATQKKEVEIKLYDDGNHNDYRKNDGIFANVFSETDEEGPYMVTGVIEGELEDGQKIKRRIFETFQVGPIDENELTASQMTEEIFKSFIPFE